MKKAVIYFSFLLTFFSSCKKDNVAGTAYQLQIINASPNAGNFELLQNLKSIGQFNYLTGLTSAVTYNSIDSGFNNYKIKKNTNEIANILFSNDGLKYSFFVCDSLTPSNVKFFFLRDKFDTTGLGKQSKIRLVHTSPNIDLVDLVTNRPSDLTQDSAVINDINYFGKYSAEIIYQSVAFQDFLTGSRTIRIKRKTDGSILKNYQFNFEKGGIYTLVLKGYDGRNTADSLSLSIIRHN